jgi:hypothetical protein
MQRSLLILVCVASCAGQRALTAPEHEARARAEERAAADDRAQLGRSASPTQCPPVGTTSDSLSAPCWSALRNPTSYYREEIEQHLRRADAHRAASRALREAEMRACTGISERDQVMSPFSHREDIAKTELLGVAARPAGAMIVFREVPGMTLAGLEQLIACHLARNAALGPDADEARFCPLALFGVSATVEETAEGLAVLIRAEDARKAREVLRRATALSPRSARSAKTPMIEPRR